MKARSRFITLDITGTLAAVKEHVGVHYLRMLPNIFPESYLQQQRFDADLLARHFRSAYKQVWQTHPNFGHGTSCSSFNWWETVTRNAFFAAYPDLAQDSIFLQNFPQLF